MKGLLQFPPMLFMKDVVLKIVAVTVVAVMVPLFIFKQMDSTFLRLVVTILVCTLSTCICIYTIGLTRNERIKVKGKVVAIINGKIERFKKR